jgi:hypothetical protein
MEGQVTQTFSVFVFVRQGLIKLLPGLASNSPSSCLSLTRAGITGVHHHTQLKPPYYFSYVKREENSCHAVSVKVI